VEFVCKEIAEPQQIARLHIWVLLDAKSQVRNGRDVVSRAVVHQSEVEIDSGHLWRKHLGLAKVGQGLGPLLAAHLHNREIYICGSRLRITAQHFTKCRVSS